MKTPDQLLKELENEEEPEKESDELPPIFPVSIDVTDGRGKRYTGKFTAKVPNLGDQIRMGQMKAGYLPQGGAADPNAMMLVEQICYLEVTLQKPRPSWWQPFQLYDATPVSALYSEVASYEARFHGEHPHQRANQDRSGESELDEGGAPAEGDAHVGRKIQPPAERREVVVAHVARGR